MTRCPTAADVLCLTTSPAVTPRCRQHDVGFVVPGLRFPLGAEDESKAMHSLGGPWARMLLLCLLS